MPGDRDAGASDGGGFDMFLQLEGDVVGFEVVVQGLRGAGIQSLVGTGRQRGGGVAVGGRRAAVVECCAVKRAKQQARF